MDRFNPEYVLVSALAVAGAFAIVSGLGALVSGVRSRHWPQVAGVITVSKMVRVSRHQNRSPVWAPDIHYRYTVGNTAMTGTLVRYGMQGLQGDQAFAAHYTDRYPVGTAVPVFVDPTRAEHAVLERGVSLKNVWPLAIGVGMLSLSLVLAAHMWNRVPN